MNFATGRQEEEDSKTFVCQWRDGARLRVVPHFSSGIVGRAKRERAWKWGDFHARSRFARPTIPEKNGGLLVVYDGAITCVFCRDLHLTLMSTGLLKTGLFKGRWSLAEIFFKQNYCHVCHTRFTVFFPLPSCCVFKTFYTDARQPKVKCFHSWAIILPERFDQIVFMRLKNTQ